MLKSQIESLLFIAARPMSLKNLSKILKSEMTEIEKNVAELEQDYSTDSRGIKLARIEDQVHLVTSPANAVLVESYLKEEISGELTRPSLETLTIIAYRGPITKPELEMVRGVNCSLILRNLLMRGLVDEKADPKTKLNKYSVTFEFLKYLGITKPSELPDYDKLSSHEILERWLQGQKPGEGDTAAVAPVIAPTTPADSK